MMRKKIVAGNWKMNLDLRDGIKLVKELVGGSLPLETMTIIAPPFIHLEEVGKQLNGTLIKLAAQNCHFKDSGAYTGEVSPTMLRSVAVEYVIVGHSERREYFGETDELILKKIKAALGVGIIPIYCCGEPLEIREKGSHQDFVRRQLNESILLLAEKEISQIVIAYEPIWAIGTGLTASPEQAQEMHAFIRQQVAETFSKTIADSISILYGGSVKPDNAGHLFSQADVDGGLVGGASLKASDFLAIVNS
ncbi:MAG: triose-phosphate isomerase [Chitinophagales bacterium]|nr:triose-phosphate isomerase [Chitinophagales bacterium]